MSSNSTNRVRWILPTRKAPLRDALKFLKRTDVWTRIGLCALTTMILFVVMFGWAPAFPYRTRLTPQRDLHARIAFEYPDIEATEAERNRATSKIPNYYENNRRPLIELRSGLRDDVFQVKQEEYSQLKDGIWPRFLGDSPEANAQAEEEFQKFKLALENDPKLETLRNAIEKAFIPFDNNGLLDKLEHDISDGSMVEIMVYPKGNLDEAHPVGISDVRIAEVRDDLHENLKREIGQYPEIFPDSTILADRIFEWFKPRLPTTLQRDSETSKHERRLATRQVGIVMKKYEPGDPLEKLSNRGLNSPVISAFEPLDDADIELLRAEHQAFVNQMTTGQRLMRSLSFFFFFAAIFAIICGYLYYRDLKLLTDIRHIATLLGLILVTLTLAWLASINVNWRSEIIPIIILAMTIAIAYHIELAIFLSAIVALLYSVAHGYGIGELVVLTTASSTAALLCRSIRSRTKLVYIGLIIALAVLPTVIGVYYLLGQPLTNGLLVDAVWFAGNAAMAGLFMTALLPFLEQWFDIQTDISLLELSDANHPLLKELVQRAPGTYNHSINVASISEAAAEAIGANGLLCRVGAYFHDIGKLRKPEYFIENQAGGENKHDDLNPTMSTLVIINHVKEGSEIARTHRLPHRIIDMIEQHHGTTLVEFFYRRASQQNELDDGGTEIHEKDYRYPGPKPQSREAVVMMLSDAVESASRALREPAPSRIESLVREIVKKRLDDRQFDECDITFQELRTIQENLVKSLNAMYHARVKYPDQQSA